MPWNQTSPMDQRTQFIADYLRQTFSIMELCQHYQVSRKTGYKWIDRYLTKALLAWTSVRGDLAIARGQHRRTS